MQWHQPTSHDTVLYYTVYAIMMYTEYVRTLCTAALPGPAYCSNIQQYCCVYGCGWIKFTEQKELGHVAMIMHEWYLYSSTLYSTYRILYGHHSTDVVVYIQYCVEVWRKYGAVIWEAQLAHIQYSWVSTDSVRTVQYTTTAESLRVLLYSTLVGQAGNGRICKYSNQTSYVYT